VKSVCHNHAPATIPFGVTGSPLRPIFHMGSVLGGEVPVWDIAAEFGDTNLLVTTPQQGDSLAKALGDRPVILMRGHGSAVAGATLRQTVFRSVYMQLNAELLTIARGFGDVRYLSDGEVAAASELLCEPLSQDRAWNEWAARVGFGGI
jgi:ribulose-5-phosphate 4-epimerase/fuculose-1-phosphate aldolase